MAILDFTVIEKEYLTVKLKDKNNEILTLEVDTPSKALCQELIRVEALLMDDKTQDDKKAVDLLYGIAAKLISRNKDGITITNKKLGECLNFGQLIQFFNGYTEYVKTTLLINQKN